MVVEHVKRRKQCDIIAINERRDDQPFGGRDPPAAVYFYSADRAGIHPERHLAGYSGILQADAYAGFNTVYRPDRDGGPITQAVCWAHGRRKFFELADIASQARNRKSTAALSPMAMAADWLIARQAIDAAKARPTQEAIRAATTFVRAALRADSNLAS
jgi:hypothetical protein